MALRITITDKSSTTIRHITMPDRVSGWELMERCGRAFDRGVAGTFEVVPDESAPIRDRVPLSTVRAEIFSK